MNYIFILLGNDSFYEAIIMSKFAEELPDYVGVFVITGQLQAAYFKDNQQILKIEMGNDMAANKKLFDKIMQEGEILGIFVFDFHKYFFKSIRPIIQFDIKWLETLNVPVNLVDFLDLFNYNEMDQIYLINSGKYRRRSKFDENLAEITDVPSEEEAVQVDTLDMPEIPEEDEEPLEDIIFINPLRPNIIKLSPPYPSKIEQESNKIFYWKCPAEKYITPELESMKEPLGITEDKKNVVLIFSYQMILQAILENKVAHYLGIIKIIILYLKILDIEMNLFIVGFDGYSDLVKGTKIKLKNFKHLNHGLYKTLITNANLVITDTPWHPVLMDAAELKIPAGVIGNSLNLLEDGTFDSEYETTDPEVFRELEISIEIAPHIFYPYIAFPLKTESPPEFTYFEKKFIYYLLDIYFDEGVIAFLGEFLITDEDVSDNLKDRQEIYKERGDDAYDTESLLIRIEQNM